jgi:hypothetical protein
MYFIKTKPESRSGKSQKYFWVTECEVKDFLAKHMNFLTKTYVLKLTNLTTKNDIFDRNDLLLVSTLPETFLNSSIATI